MKSFMRETDQDKKALMLALILVLLSHCMFEVTGEFFWSLLYGQIFVAFMGFLCSFATQIRQEQQNSTSRKSPNEST